MVAKTKGALLDATLITPKTETTIEVATSEDESPTVKGKTSADLEVSWVKKGNKFHYGYRGYAVVDNEGYLLGAHQ